MKEIYLVNNKGIVLVDDEDFEKLNKYKWYLHTKGYARRRGTMIKGVLSKSIYIHKEILNFPELIIDHKDGNKLNCQKSNLRLSTNSQNAANSNKFCKATSKYKGVYWSSRDKVWISEIRINKKRIYLGRSHNEHEAAQLYNNGAIKYFGEYAKLNIIND